MPANIPTPITDSAEAPVGKWNPRCRDLMLVTSICSRQLENSLHVAEDGLKEIANDSQEIMRLEIVDKAEQRAWRAIANKAKNALARIEAMKE